MIGLISVETSAETFVKTSAETLTGPSVKVQRYIDTRSVGLAINN